MRASFQAATIVVVAGLALAGCGRKTGAPAPAAAGPETVTAADTIYAGGDIVTVNDAQPGVEALAVKDGRILAVGPRADIEKAHKGAATRRVDLGGKTLLPGFIDAHGHYINSLLVANQAKLYSMGSEVALFVGVTAIATHIMIVAKVELHKFCNTQKIIKLSKELPTKSTESHKKGISELI